MKSRYKFLVIISLIQASACSQFATHRDFLSEMEADDSRFYNPSKDFPVVVGDNGEFGITEDERRARTPASSYDVAAERSTLSLEQELIALEEKQSENALNFYNKYRHKLATTSERIYFLKLPHYDRHDYLDSRGILEKDTNLYTSREKDFAIRQSDILLGMTKEDVTSSWGHPTRVEVAGNPSYENERWLYKKNGASKYIYFESGKVEGWE